MVRSLLWPGAFNFFTNGQIKQIYLGNGQKFEQKAPCYYPINPPSINEDPSEYGDGPEPTPLEEPVAEVAEPGSQDGSVKDDEGSG